MTALVLENLAALPGQVQSLRMLLARVARALDALVSARAARRVPEWRMQEVQSEINRYQNIVRTGDLAGRRRRRRNSGFTVASPRPMEASISNCI